MLAIIVGDTLGDELEECGFTTERECEEMSSVCAVSTGKRANP
jgi:hypothetical protein